jgi:RNA polymerase sigma-70 factor (ECF subfamily)
MNSKQLEQWYELYGYAVHRRCLHLLGSEMEADDALQEVFLRAERHGYTLRDASPLHWLYRIADNHCFDVLRTKRRHVDSDEAMKVMRAREESTADASNLERVHLVAQVLAACNDKVREIATLYHVDELTQDEVAAATGYSRKTVKEKLARFQQVAAELLGLSKDEGEP